MGCCSSPPSAGEFLLSPHWYWMTPCLPKCEVPSLEAIVNLRFRCSEVPAEDPQAHMFPAAPQRHHTAKPSPSGLCKSTGAVGIEAEESDSASESLLARVAGSSLVKSCSRASYALAFHSGASDNKKIEFGVFGVPLTYARLQLQKRNFLLHSLQNRRD